MTPLGREPRVIEIKPANECPDVECGGDRGEFVVCAGNAAAVGNTGSRNKRAEQLCAGRIIEREEGTAKRVHQTIASRFVGFGAEGSRLQDVIHYFGK